MEKHVSRIYKAIWPLTGVLVALLVQLLVYLAENSFGSSTIVSYSFFVIKPLSVLVGAYIIGLAVEKEIKKEIRKQKNSLK